MSIAEQMVARYQKRKEEAENYLRWVEERGVRFSEATGNEPMVDITDRTIGEKRQLIADRDKWIALWKRDLAGLSEIDPV